MVYQSGLRLGSNIVGLVVQVSGGVPDAQKERRPASQDQLNLREKGSTQFSGRAHRPAHFFVLHAKRWHLRTPPPYNLQVAPEQQIPSMIGRNDAPAFPRDKSASARTRIYAS